MAERAGSWLAGYLARSITAQKAARVKLETGPEPLDRRLDALAALWEKRASTPGYAGEASTLEWCAEELRAELERGG